MEQWNLEALFKNYEDPLFLESFEQLKKEVDEANEFVDNLSENHEQNLLKYIRLASHLRSNSLRLYAFINLQLATNAQDEVSMTWLNRIQQLTSKTTPFYTKISKYIPTIDNLETVIDANETLKEYRFHFLSIKDRAQYVLSDKEEAIISKLTQTGSSAWGRLQSLLTSIVEVDFEGKTVNLSTIRNKAHSSNPKTREEAYYAELKAYKKIEQSLAYALSSIKGEVNEISALRGFESPLHEAVYNSRMQKDTLDALIKSMRKYLPVFRSYLKRKASMLGHKNGLPWYDLFAPLGKSNREFTSEEAIDYIVKNFKTFGDDLANLASRAYKDKWIDFTPRQGKRGGAFCMNLHPIKQSRILTNFDGSFSNVITLAHELGHAYHGDRIFKESMLNASYTMPVAETASTLCETIVKRAALNETEGDEKLFILEQSLMGSTQVIVDILSRFIFEENVFKARKESILSPTKYNQMMLDAQKEAYGDALNQDTLHPYMWANKGHYYSGSLSFYNFPYAFGLLFAKGIYAKFTKEGKTFTEKIDLLLQKTGQMSVEEVAGIVGIDVSTEAFWDSSLEVIKEEIELFLSLTE
ncbi:MAG: M3 family oligoendopeptidase [Candidatus Izemoplasmataceae bacterium]